VHALYNRRPRHEIATTCSSEPFMADLRTQKVLVAARLLLSITTDASRPLCERSAGRRGAMAAFEVTAIAAADKQRVEGIQLALDSLRSLHAYPAGQHGESFEHVSGRAL